MTQALAGAQASAANPGRAEYRAALHAEWIKVRTGSGSAWRAIVACAASI